jgi:hypothetical protein
MPADHFYANANAALAVLRTVQILLILSANLAEHL